MRVGVIVLHLLCHSHMHLIYSISLCKTWWTYAKIDGNFQKCTLPIFSMLSHEQKLNTVTLTWHDISNTYVPDRRGYVTDKIYLKVYNCRRHCAIFKIPSQIIKYHRVEKHVVISVSGGLNKKVTKTKTKATTTTTKQKQIKNNIINNKLGANNFLSFA